MSRRTMYIVAAVVVAVLVVAYALGLFGGGEVAAPTTPPATGTPGTTQ